VCCSRQTDSRLRHSEQVPIGKRVSAIEIEIGAQQLCVKLGQRAVDSTSDYRMQTTCRWDSEVGSPVPVLKELGRMCVDETETDPDSGEVTVTAAKKIRALGVRGFLAKCAPPSQVDGAVIPLH
jgi:hypothetical protein